MLNCDAETGVCSLPETSDNTASHLPASTVVPAVRYIGDPMCSWCWGISPALKEVATYSQKHGLDFSVHVGGLRPGGGDEWNSSFKAFLRHEWENIHRVTGQPFGFTILDEAEFNYDTEPACRAVVTMSQLQESNQVLLAFFSGIQRRFYVDGADPKQPAFYRTLCAEADVSYEDFLKVEPCQLLCPVDAGKKGFQPTKISQQGLITQIRPPGLGLPAAQGVKARLELASFPAPGQGIKPHQ